MECEYKTTVGTVDDYGANIVADDPIEPEERAGWQLVSSTCEYVRNKLFIFWFWRRDK